LRCSPLDELSRLLGQGSVDTPRFTLTQVLHAGINALPAGERQRQVTLPRWIPAAVAAQAQASGYANAFEAVAAELPWKTPLHSDDGRALHPAPYPGGPLTATVVGPHGETSGSGAQEIHTDRLGRIRIRFDFQTAEAGADTPETSHSSTWVRVLQRQAGPGMGWHFIPRLGQEVLVDFMDARIDRPVVIAALYNGQGEAGLVPTPGGAPPAANDDNTSLAHSADHRPSGQGNRIGTGHSPAWHGAGGASLQAGGQASATGALNGIKTQEFGGSGYNQLVFDDIYRRTRMLLPATAIAMLAACQPQTVTMTPEETQRVAQLTERMTPRCVGRYLIDLPASFVLNSQWSAVIDGVKVDVRPMTKTMFDASLAAYRNRLEETKLPLNGFPFLRSVIKIETGVMFDMAASEA
jgi:type VI secretion system secreted protein VgrG